MSPLLLIAACLSAPPGDAATARSTDTVLLLGGTMVEREQEHGHWEAAIRLADRDTRYRVRNLAWSGDTVWAESRGRFDPPPVAYTQLIEEAAAIAPSRIVLGYGTAEAYSDVTPDDFVAQLTKLIEDLPPASLVVLGTNRVGLARLPEAVRKARAERLEAFDAILKRVAAKHDARFVSLAEYSAADLTSDGIQWNDSGYAATAATVAEAFAEAEPLTPSNELLAAIRQKNRLVFHRYRPQNMTYLKLFRKHEQGQNAVEIEQFETSIEAADAAIDALIANRE